MEWLEGLGLFGLFIGTFLAATLFPFSSDALYLAILAATGNPIGCLLAGTLGNWLGSVLTFWIGWIGKWEWIEKWFKWTMILLLVGKFARFLAWNLLYGLF